MILELSLGKPAAANINFELSRPRDASNFFADAVLIG